MTRKSDCIFFKLRKRHREIVETQEWLRSVLEAQAAGLPQPGLNPVQPRIITTDDIID